MMLRCLFVCLGVLSLAACVTPGGGSQAEGSVSAGRCGEPLPAEVGVGLSLVQQQRASGQLYRALASLDGLPSGTPTYQLLRADILRELGREADADALYAAVLKTCLRGEARYGIALLRAGQHRIDDAEANFRLATADLPTDPDLRNDHGFWLLAQGHDEAARRELLTALELDDSHPKASRNLYFLLIKRGEDQAADALARRFGWTAEELAPYHLAVARFTPLTRGGTP